MTGIGENPDLSSQIERIYDGYQNALEDGENSNLSSLDQTIKSLLDKIINYKTSSLEEPLVLDEHEVKLLKDLDAKLNPTRTAAATFRKVFSTEGNAEDFLRERYLEDGKITASPDSREFTKEDSKAMSKAGASRGLFKNVGMGIREQFRRNARHEKQAIAKKELVTLFEAASLDTNQLTPYIRELGRMEERFKKLESSLKPYLKNPHFAAEYAQELRDHARFILEEKIPAVALQYYQDSKDGMFKAAVNKLTEQGVSLKEAVGIVWGEQRKTEGDFLIKEAYQLQEKAMLWARYAADRGKPLGALLVSESYFSLGNWSPAQRKQTFETALRFANQALYAKHSTFSENVFKTDALLAIGALNEKRMHLALSEFKLHPENKTLAIEAQTARDLAVQAYKEAKPEGSQGLYQLFLMGSETAGEALLERLKEKTTITPKDQFLIQVLRDARIEGVQQFIAEQELTITIESSTLKQAQLHLKNKEQWEPERDFEGKVLTAEFSQDGQVTAKEVVTRTDTVPLLIKGLKTKLEVLEKQKSAGKGSDDIEQQIASVKEQIGRYEKNSGKATWASTNAPRLLFHTTEDEKQAEELYLPVLGNHRMQTVEDRDGNKLSTIARSAAITDFSHGDISLQELQDYSALKMGMSAKARALLKFYDLFLPDGTTVDSKKYNALIERIEAGAVRAYGEDMLLTYEKGNKKLDETKLTAVIKKREELIKLQFLQDLHEQFRSRPVTEGSVVVGRVSLVDMTKPPERDRGFVNNERTQGLDMKALYDKLDGAEVVFDIENPDGGTYFDESGKIHMPKAFYTGENSSDLEPKTTKIKSLFFNVSVQRNTQNEGLQKTINEQAIQKLKQLIPSAAEEDSNSLNLIEDLLKRSKIEDPYVITEEIVELMRKLNCYVSMNCYGAKDRTGYVAAAATRRILKSLTPNTAVLKRWQRELLSDRGNLLRIVFDNAKHNSFKITKLSPDLYGVEDAEGALLRLKHIRRSAGVFCAQLIEKKIRGRSPIFDAARSSQLYGERKSVAAQHKVKEVKDTNIFKKFFRKITERPASHLYDGAP